MSKTFLTKTHLTDTEGNLIAPDTEIEVSKLGDAATIKRYQELEAIEDAKAGVIVTGDDTEEAREKAEKEAVEKAKADADAKSQAEKEAVENVKKEADGKK